MPLDDLFVGGLAAECLAVASQDHLEGEGGADLSAEGVADGVVDGRGFVDERLEVGCGIDFVSGLEELVGGRS
ncbi:hypothetical protein OG455_00135 [Kitasatospora sp. NBC_01287]|uniref:hypothetical protein n=1 Tax=Kitasatospora sp. NBC_01287 TaxID=2903573 RepID=UPI00224FCC82|nr:hypothetical protein [Kitasatospora sp. NBC_01287]MCX4743936.1 hypothetical protein [Kitasatospora sp. NBC_01287]